MKLYHAPQSRSVRPRWLLEEIGVPYDLVRMNLQAGDTKRPEYLKINPNGAVPALQDGDLCLFESAAICLYLTDKFPEKRLAPPVGTPARGLYYQWVQYAMNGLEPPAVDIFAHTMMRPEGERIAQVVNEARPRLAAAVKVVDGALAGRDYLLGTEFSTADVMVGSTLAWAAMLGAVSPEFANVAGYVARLGARPAYQRAAAD
jgi:glutathione S-transferase